MQRRVRTLSFLLVVVFACISATTVRADEVTDWNQILFQAAHEGEFHGQVEPKRILTLRGGPATLIQSGVRAASSE